MMRHHTARLSVVLVSLLVGAGCGSSATDSSPAADQAPDVAAAADSVVKEAGDEPSSDGASSDDGEVGFGELIEGTFIFTGAIDERYHVSDDGLRFQLGGGCQDGAFGFSINIYETETDAAIAGFAAQMQQDLSGGGTGEFDPVEAEFFFIPSGDITQSEGFDGPLRMVISEHDTGGATADLNARRMTVSLLGTITTETGDVDVDITFRWVMGCP